MSQRLRSDPSSGEMPLEPLVDVVFQLLVFFLFTFQIRLMERLYWVETPAATANAAPNQQPTIHVRLHARKTGQLATIGVEQEQLQTIDRLETVLQHRVAVSRGGSPRVLLRPDAGIEYHSVVQAALAARRAGCDLSLMPAEQRASP